MNRIIRLTLFLLALGAAPAFAQTGRIYIDPSTVRLVSMPVDGISVSGAAERVDCDPTGPSNMNGGGGAACQFWPDGNVPITLVRFPAGTSTVANYPIVYPADAPYLGACTAAATPYACCTGNGTGCTTPFNLKLWFAHGNLSPGATVACRRWTMGSQVATGGFRNYDFGAAVLTSMSPGYGGSNFVTWIQFGSIFGVGPTARGDDANRGAPAVLRSERVPSLCLDTYNDATFETFLVMGYGF